MGKNMSEEEKNERMTSFYERVMADNKIKATRMWDVFSEVHPIYKTNFMPIDLALGSGLKPGLYVMAAESSVGKSAISLTLAQNLTECADVLYFAIEMSEKELIARGISRISFENHLKDDKHEAFKFSEILDARYDEFRHDFVKVFPEEYKDDYQEYMDRYGEHLIIVSCEKEKFTIGEICNFTLMHKRRCGRPVVVFIDYLQLICSMQAEGDIRMEVDNAVGDLKKLSIENNIPVFAISSVNRASYGKGVGMSSGKESSALEFTGDEIIGYDWDGVTNADNPERADDKRVEDDARGYRKMKFRVLKNRNGRVGAFVYLKYYPAYNYFEEWVEEIVDDPSLPFGDGWDSSGKNDPFANVTVSRKEHK